MIVSSVSKLLRSYSKKFASPGNVKAVSVKRKKRNLPDLDKSMKNADPYFKSTLAAMGNVALEPDVSRIADTYDDLLEDAVKLDTKLRRQKMQRKHFKKLEKKEINLLTWAEKEHIRSMHKSDPTHWTPETLAECYPITPEGVEKLLRSTFKPCTLTELKKHDENVAQKIRDIQSGKIPMTESLREKMEARMAVPFTIGGVPDTQTNLLATTTNHQHIGEFQKIVSDRSSNTENSLTVAETPTEIIPCNRPLRPIHASVSQFEPEHGDTKILRNDGSLLRLGIKPKTEMTFSQFEKEILSKEKKFSQNITVQSMKQFNDDPVGDNYDTTVDLNEEFRLTEIDYLHYNQIKKYKDSEGNMEIKVENGKPYVYNPKVGYEKLFDGEVTTKDDKDIKTSAKISIPSHLRKPGAIYRVGDSFYDDEGEFLYKAV